MHMRSSPVHHGFLAASARSTFLTTLLGTGIGRARFGRAKAGQGPARVPRLAYPVLAAALLIAGVCVGGPAYAASAGQAAPAACKASAASDARSPTTPTAGDTAAPNAVQASAPAPQVAGNNGYGKLYFTQGCEPKNCSAVSLTSPDGDFGIIETARHCVEGADRGSIYYYPGYDRGSAPNGRFQVRDTYYFSSASRPGHQWDYAFAVVGRGSTGRSLASVGAYGFSSILNLTSISGVATLSYYTPQNRQAACTNRTIQNYPYASRTWQMDNCDIRAGASGSPLFQQVGPDHRWMVVGVLIGFTGPGGIDAFGHYNEANAQELYDDAWHRATG
jgi:hypothetical protein